ncbi:MAG: hypothetical protein AAGI66_04250 [Cyanobacteria bacterium P01_H01_bin.74]
MARFSASKFFLLDNAISLVSLSLTATVVISTFQWLEDTNTPEKTALNAETIDALYQEACTTDTAPISPSGSETATETAHFICLKAHSRLASSH